jgi:hypothetical protein
MRTLILEGRAALRIGSVIGAEELAASTVHQLMVINRRVQGVLPHAVARPQGFQAQGNRMRPQALPPRLPPNGAVQRRVEFHACLEGQRLDHLPCGGRLVPDTVDDCFKLKRQQAGVRRRGLQEKRQGREREWGCPAFAKGHEAGVRHGEGHPLGEREGGMEKGPRFVF